MTPESVTIVLPLPARVLQPNCTIATLGGRFLKARATKRYRRLACEAMEAENVESKPWGKVVLETAFFHVSKRRRDNANATASLKAAQDGIVDAGLISDDDSEHLKNGEPTFAIDKLHPRVELTVVRLA